MDFKKGDTFINLSNNITFYVREVKGDDVMVCWSFKAVPFKDWKGNRNPQQEQVIEFGEYVEYRCWKTRKRLHWELTDFRHILKPIGRMTDEDLIMKWAPQHNFIKSNGL
jgi:hypothetical protein